MQSFLTRYAWIIENTPTILFFAVWRSGAALEEAAWIAAFAAFCVLVWLWRSGQQPDTVLLGINLHFVLSTTAIQIVYSAGFTELAITLIRHAGVAVPGFILLTGLGLTVLTRSGFLGCETQDQPKPKHCSALLFIWTMIACAWSYSFMGDQILSVGLPILSIFMMRRLLSNSGAMSRLLPLAATCLLQPSDLPRRARTAARSFAV